VIAFTFTYFQVNVQVAQKMAPFLYALTLSNINRCLKLFYDQNQEKICNNAITKDCTTPVSLHYLVKCQLSEMTLII